MPLKSLKNNKGYPPRMYEIWFLKKFYNAYFVVSFIKFFSKKK